MSGLKIGDRVGLFAFDERPRLRTGTVAGPARVCADCIVWPRNWTIPQPKPISPWALTQLATDLKHRSIVIVFTDFVDTTSAELMLENIAAAWLQRHLVSVRPIPRCGA